MNSTSFKHGFTLIELMIAITLGMMIVMVATAGVRLAAQTMTKCNRMSLENSLVRAAVIQACDEVDFWTMLDHPSDTKMQSLRKTANDGGWQPFAPFSVSKILASETAPNFTRVEPELVLTWESSPMAWAAHDARTWCRANLVECAGTDLRYGDYSLFSFDRPQNNLPTYDPSRCRNWYANQVRHAFDGLGFYGALEYLPSSALLVYHGTSPASGGPSGMNKGKVPKALLNGQGWMGAKFQAFSSGRFRMTDSSVIPMPNPVINILPQFNGTKDPFRVSWRVGYAGKYVNDGAAEAVKFHQATAFGGALMELQPQSWPDVSVKVERLIRQSRAVAICIIDITDPVTGSTTTIPFSTRGTSFRGARQQRSTIGDGWATYDNVQGPSKPVIGESFDNERNITY